jgi:hypothetical protein
VKSAGEAVEILEAFDLTGSLRGASELVGCSPNTVARYVRLRAIGRPSTEPTRRTQLIDPHLAKIEEWVERSHGNVRADVVHDKLQALGFGGSERTTRRAVAQAKKAYERGHRRVFRPWIPEPGMWLQFDWGKGPRIGRRETLLWCAWLAWSHFRVVIPTWDRTMPTVIACPRRPPVATDRQGRCTTFFLGASQNADGKRTLEELTVLEAWPVDAQGSIKTPLEGTLDAATLNQKVEAAPDSPKGLYP